MRYQLATSVLLMVLCACQQNQQKPLSAPSASNGGQSAASVPNAVEGSGGGCGSVANCAQMAVQAAQNAQIVASQAIPKGMIAAFNGGCPPGWDEFADAKGRFLYGGDAGTVGQKLGSPTAKLSVSNLPPHRHETALQLILVIGPRIKLCSGNHGWRLGADGGIR